MDKKKIAFVLGVIIGLLFLCSTVWIAFMYWDKPKGGAVAYIYQDNNLIKTIELAKVDESYTFVVENEQGGTNEIEVRPGSIGIVKASCPDHLCMNMGFIKNNVMPVTCLPNHLVIEVKVTGAGSNDTDDGLDGKSY